MEKFKRSINGYNIDEVNAFIDDVITKVELIITEEKKIKNDIVIKEKKIRELEDAILRYQNMENQLHTSLLNAEQNGEYIKKVAKSEGNAIISASRKDMIGSSLYLVGKNFDNDEYVKDARPCAMCKRVIINSGIEKIYIRNDKEKYTEINVNDFITNDESLKGILGY